MDSIDLIFDPGLTFVNIITFVTSIKSNGRIYSTAAVNDPNALV